MVQKGKRKPTPMSELVPVEIPDAEHDLVIERATAIDVAKGVRQGVSAAAGQVRAAV